MYTLRGQGVKGSVFDEAPMSMLVPIYIMVAGIMLLGVFSGKIISTVIQFAVPTGF